MLVPNAMFYLSVCTCGKNIWWNFNLMFKFILDKRWDSSEKIIVESRCGSFFSDTQSNSIWKIWLFFYVIYVIKKITVKQHLFALNRVGAL